jgi:hypothetical protein
MWVLLEVIAKGRNATGERAESTRAGCGFKSRRRLGIPGLAPPVLKRLGPSFMVVAFLRNRPYDPQSLDATQNAKEVLTRYRGLTCGVRYAEAVRQRVAAGTAVTELFIRGETQCVTELARAISSWILA